MLSYGQLGGKDAETYGKKNVENFADKTRQIGFTGHDVLIISYSTTFPDDKKPNKNQIEVAMTAVKRALQLETGK